MFLADLRYGIRLMLKRPSLSATAIVALALGIGLTAAAFSILQGCDPPGASLRRAAASSAIGRQNLSRGVPRMGLDIHDFLDWRDRQTTFEGIAGLRLRHDERERR